MKKLVAALLIPLTACSAHASLGKNEVSPTALTKQVGASLEKKFGVPAKNVHCADPLKAKKGAHARCELTNGALLMGMTVTTSKVVDGKAKFDIKIDPTPTSVTSAGLEQEISERLERKFSKRPDAVDCPKRGLEAKVGASVRCMITGGTTKVGATVKATNVEAQNVEFDINVDAKPAS